MNIKDIPYTEYYYIFEIDCVKKACSIIDSLKCLIDKYQDIHLQDKEQIKIYVDDFKQVGNNLITREEITDYTDYENNMKTLAIINAKIQAIIYSYNLQNINIDIEKYCKYINSLLSFTHTAKDIFMQNHSTTFFLIGITLFFGFIAFLFRNNINLFIITILLWFLFTTIALFLNKTIKKHLKVNQINKTLNLNTYPNSRKLKTYRKVLIKLIKSNPNIH